MPLPESYWPRKKIGELSPTNTGGAYEWYYFSIPRGVSTVALPVGMEEFTPKEIQRVFAPAADYARTLAKYDVDVIVQGGVPLPCVMGPDFLDELLGRMHEATRIPTTANVLSMVAGAKRLGLKNIALANKWTDPMNENLAKFFKREGIDVAGWSTHVMTPKKFEGMCLQEGGTGPVLPAWCDCTCEVPRGRRPLRRRRVVAGPTQRGTPGRGVRQTGVQQLARLRSAPPRVVGAVGADPWLCAADGFGIGRPRGSVTTATWDHCNSKWPATVAGLRH